MVRSRRSSKLLKVGGPLMKSNICLALAGVTPGVTSTKTTFRTSSGATSVRLMVVMPPRDIPTTAAASGASWRMATATSSALAWMPSRRLATGRPPSE